MSSLTSLGFTATQYALFSSLYALPGKILAAVSGRVVEAATAAAASGGGESLRGWFTGMSPSAFAHLAQQRAIPAEALAAGYMVFFLYSGATGVLALVFALAVMRASPPPRAP
jgi:PAT family beta-lactamase induction signal transducer AmpG